ncbi:uncharacterized protein CMU_000310 [Cryptosporidium muris RN66]|uniref:WD40 repeat-containing protein SMU1 n=1 Tax=Cryptosporidium muris (strain RN66) TaxID=441375 RepID=B6AG20_CRYMR|nr:uncharacterized protein CMU_000310 [Cryptosporidium muris RN66]EEA07161.1 hypothetical protein, conserved [Cryptosporidium muris RN66]|eukprot:XP_002141510.1 hypothetical protein [Cryptosporidium muris RN66]
MEYSEVSNNSIIRVILQFLAENGLEKSFHVLQQESGIYLNGVNSVKLIHEKITSGDWDHFFSLTKIVNLPVDMLVNCYEHIITELLENMEPYAAKFLLKNTKPCIFNMKVSHPSKYNMLLELTNKAICVIETGSNEIEQSKSYQVIAKLARSNYMESNSRTLSRLKVADMICNFIDEIKPSKLLEIIGIAIKAESERYRTLGNINYDGTINAFDIGETKTSSQDFNNRKLNANLFQETDNNPRSIICAIDKFENINFSTKEFGRINCVTFSPDESNIIIGTSLGFICIWSWISDELSKKIDTDDFFFSYKSDKCSIISVCSSIYRSDVYAELKISNYGVEESPSFLIASSSENCELKLWDNFKNLIYCLQNIHDKPVTCMTFNKDGSCILSGSYDGSVRIHGLRSRRMLKYFKHINNSSFVNTAVYNSTEALIISGYSDGTINVWDTRNCECIATYPLNNSSIIYCNIIDKPYLLFKLAEEGYPEVLNNKKKITNTSDIIILCTSYEISILNICSGKINNLYNIADKGNDGIFIRSIALHPSLHWIYILCSNNCLFCINITKTESIDYILISENVEDIKNEETNIKSQVITNKNSNIYYSLKYNTLIYYNNNEIQLYGVSIPFNKQ